MHATWMLALLLTGAGGGDKPAVSHPAHVRAAANATRVVDDAAAQSATIRELLERLAATDVIVYVELTGSPQVPTARTKLVAATPSARFLRVGINSATPPFELPALLGHELQHALEIAEHVEVRDDAGMRRLYAAIGREQGIDRFETDAAVRVERAVRFEVAGAGVAASCLPAPRRAAAAGRSAAAGEAAAAR